MLLTMDTRFSVQFERGKNMLSISSVRKEDAGEYVCQETTMDGVREQIHLLNVLGRLIKTQCKQGCQCRFPYGGGTKDRWGGGVGDWRVICKKEGWLKIRL